MKKNILIKKSFILLLIMATFLVFFSNCQVKATSIEKTEEKSDEVVIEEEKIMKYNRLTNETTEVDMDELIKNLNRSVNKNEINFFAQDNNISNKLLKQNKPIPSKVQGSAQKVTNTSISPYKSVCRITYSYNNTNVALGSAVLVGNEVALTAAHCVFNNNNNNQVFPGWTIYPGYDDGYYCGTPTGWDTVYYSSSYFSASDQDKYKYDWAICVLQANESSVGYLTPVTYASNNSLNGTYIKILGYPGDSNYGYYIDARYQYESSGQITNVENEKFACSAFSCPGFSGGPVIRTSDNSIVGILVGTSASSSHAVRITSGMISIINSLNNS